MSSDNRSAVIYKLLDNLKMNLVSEEDKKIISKIVDSLEMPTNKQKRRFKILYQLTPDSPKYTTLSEFARAEGCTYGAIKTSVSTLRNRFINHSKDEDIENIKKINEKIEKKRQNNNMLKDNL